MLKKSNHKRLIIFLNILLVLFIITTLSSCQFKKTKNKKLLLLEKNGYLIEKNGYLIEKNDGFDYYYKNTIENNILLEYLNGVDYVFNEYGYKKDILNNYTFVFTDTINSPEEIDFLNNAEYLSFLEKEKIILLSSLDFALDKSGLFLKIFSQTNLKNYNYFIIDILEKETINKDELPNLINKIKNENFFIEKITFNPVFIIDRSNLNQSYKEYIIICKGFCDYLIDKNQNIVKDILKNEEDTEKIKSNYEKWLLEYDIYEKIFLSKKTININYDEFLIFTEKRNILKIKKEIFNNDIRNVDFDINYYLSFLNKVDENIFKTKEFLKGANTNISEEMPITIVISKADNYTLRLFNTIYLSETGIENSFLHELTHLFLIVDRKSKTNQANDPFKYVYEEGIAEYIELCLSSANIDYINENYFDFDKYEKQEKLKLRNTILLNYLKEKKNIDVYKEYLDAGVYIDSCAYLSLTNKDFLDSYKSFENIYMTKKPALNSYEESVSFVKFIIDNYGKEKFFLLQKRYKTYEEIFNKTYVTILNEWLDYLEVDKENNILNEQGKIKEYKNNLYY